MELTTMKISVPVLMMMLFQTGDCGFSGRFVRKAKEMSNMTPMQEIEARRNFWAEVEGQPVAQPASASREAPAAGEKGAPKPAVQEEETWEPISVEEVQFRIQNLQDWGGNTSILDEFTDGVSNREQIRQCRAALNRADAEIERLMKEAEAEKRRKEEQEKQIKEEQKYCEEVLLNRKELKLLNEEIKLQAKRSSQIEEEKNVIAKSGTRLIRFSNRFLLTKEMVKLAEVIDKRKIEFAIWREESKNHLRKEIPAEFSDKSEKEIVEFIRYYFREIKEGRGNAEDGLMDLLTSDIKQTVKLKQEELRLLTELIKKNCEYLRILQRAEVKLRQHELKELGGNPGLLKKFKEGIDNADGITAYRATMNRVNEEIARLKREARQREEEETHRMQEKVEELEEKIKLETLKELSLLWEEVR